MRLLLLIPIALCSAQMHDEDVSTWIYNALNNGIGNGPDARGATLPPQETTPVTPPKFTLTLRKPSRPCVTVNDREGKCVKPQYCKEPPPQIDPSVEFFYGEIVCPYLLQCCPLDKLKPAPKKTNTLPDGCGWSNPGRYNFHDDSDEFSNYAEFPWMVAILSASYGNELRSNDFIADGTLINPSVVLTVAHKVASKNANEIKCRAGEWDFRTDLEIYPHQDRNIRKIAIHENFVRLWGYYDAALLFLEAAFQLKDMFHIGTACLARDMPAPGTLCYSMGWGSSFNDTNNISLPQKIQVQMVEPDLCQRQLRNTRLGRNYLLHDSLFCAAGEDGKITRIGYGGAPLVCPVPSGSSMQRFAVYGMVVYGLDYRAKDIPAVYAKVPPLLDWIDQQMAGEQLNTTSYYL